MNHVNVFAAGQDGYFCFRIPVLAIATDGSYLAFAEARKYNRSDPGTNDNEIHLVVKRSTDGGQTWSKTTVIEAPGDRWSAANASAVVDRQNQGRIWLHYLRCKPGRGARAARPGTDDLQNLARYSDDHGVTWSEPMDLTAVCRDMNDSAWCCSIAGPGGGAQDRSGRMIIPHWKWPYGVFAIFSEDHGQTWERGQFVPDLVGNENHVVELSDGRLLLDFRQSGPIPHRWMTESRDGGRTWSSPRPGLKVDHVCCAIERCPVRSGDQGRPRLIWTGPRGPGRANLVARFSDDDGMSFPVERTIAEEIAAYSDLAALGDDSVGVLWERGNNGEAYQFMTFTRLGPEFLYADRVGT